MNKVLNRICMLYAESERARLTFSLKLKRISVQVYIQSYFFYTVLQLNQLVFDERSRLCQVSSIRIPLLRKKSLASKYVQSKLIKLQREEHVQKDSQFCF